MPARDDRPGGGGGKRGGGRCGVTSEMDAINKETIKKEMRHFKIHENYSPKRLEKDYTLLTDKPNNIVPDTSFPEILENSLLESKKVEEAQQSVFHVPNNLPMATASQEYGWFPKPLMWNPSPLFNHPRAVTEITLLYGPAEKKKSTSSVPQKK